MILCHKLRLCFLPSKSPKHALSFLQLPFTLPSVILSKNQTVSPNLILILKNTQTSLIRRIPMIYIQSYKLSIQMKSKEYDHLYKFVMVGDSAVGKSSLLLRFADDDFNENYMITIGVDFRFKSININQKVVKMQIWDTAGQERFRTIVNTYYKNSHAVFLVFDLTNRDSFQDIKSYWINEVQSYTDAQASLVLVGNKADAPNRQVQQQEINAFITDKNLQYYETSAKTGQNVRDMFITVATRLSERTPEAGTGGRQKGESLQKVAEENSDSGWKKCAC